MSAVLIVKANVASYDPWRTNYDAGITLRRENGVTADEVFCSPEDMTSILVLHFFESVAAARAFAANPRLAEAMKASGVIGTPHMTITETV
jgi:2,4-dienoyl-CoA reductase-like NADH-dependent reductase (Old Yellow Enzyme family)